MYVNGSLCPLRVLEELGGTLVDIHGQHEQQSLLAAPNNWMPLMRSDVSTSYAGGTSRSTKDGRNCARSWMFLCAAEAWLERSELPPVIGVWWVHAAALALGIYLVARDARKA